MGSFFFYGLVLVTSTKMTDIWRHLFSSNEAESVEKMDVERVFTQKRLVNFVNNYKDTLNRR